MPADIVPGIHRLIAGGSTSTLDGTTAPTTASAAIPVRAIDNRGAVTTVRASTDYNTSTTTTNGTDQRPYGGVQGMYLFIDQSSVLASSVGGGTGVMTHTLQIKDPIGATYTGSTVSIVLTTGIGTWIFNCYPGNTTLAPTSGAPGKADLPIGPTWRMSSVASSSATNFIYSVAAIYLPTAASSS